MPDLIDREELLNILEKNNEIYWGTAGGGYPVSKDIFEEIKFMNKADTERHAYWIDNGDTYECSNCGDKFYGVDTEYCSSCGCNMNEVEE